MKKVFSCIVMLFCLPIFCGCQYVIVGLMMMFMGTFYVTDPAEYGKFETYIESELGYFPESLDGYTVNSYAYTRYEYLDLCYEVFLDLTVSKTQMEELISAAKAYEDFQFEQVAYYAEGYYEIVLYEDYEIVQGENVGWATIDKVIYNPETQNVIYESFHAHDTGVYELKDVAYFNRFGIDQYDYVENMQSTEKDDE